MQIDIKKVKIFVTVPLENIESVRETVCRTGAGVIGNYSYCTYATKGKGTFIPSVEASPYIGKANKLEIVDEIKLEFICNIEKVKSVLIELKKVHPYEEPAIDIVPLIDESEF